MPAASSDGVMLRAHAIVETRYRENIHDRISFESVLALLLFVAVYAPAFALVTWLRPSVEVTIPLIIAASTAIAAICIGPLASLTKGIAEFGVARAPCRIGALALGMIAAIRSDESRARGNRPSSSRTRVSARAASSPANAAWAAPEGMKLRLDISAQLASRVADKFEPRDLLELAAADAHGTLVHNAAE